MKVIRKKLGLTQVEFAKAIGCYQKTIVRWEKGQTRPSLTISQFKRLCGELEKVGLTYKDLPEDLN